LRRPVATAAKELSSVLTSGGDVRYDHRLYLSETAMGMAVQRGLKVPAQGVLDTHMRHSV